ncbi:MAG: ATP-binding protein [Anaerolineales bacterium]|nr:ATP-binding protein [Anaerolineales bacterium]
MDSLIAQTFTLLTTPPGNLIYHLVLVFSVAGALQSTFHHWRSSEFPQARRALTGLTILLVAQLTLFAFSGLGWQGLLNPTVGLPPMDRGFIIFGIIWITWLWAFPEPSRAADAAALLLTLLVATAMGMSILTWQPQASQINYNSTVDDLAWQIASLIFIAIGALVLFIRKPDGFWNGIAFLTLAFLGHVGYLMFGAEGNYSGIVRVAYMAAYPILLTLPQRFPAPDNTASKPTLEKSQDALPAGIGQERRRYSTDPKTFHAMLSLAAETNATKVSHAITRVIAQTMLADLCFLIYLTDNNNQAVIAGGYDLIREESLEGGSLNKSAIPMLANSLQRGKPLRLPASSTSVDIKGLAEILGIANPGHLMSVPIITAEKESMGGIILLSPYSNRMWSAEDQAFLSNIATSIVPIIQRNQRVSKLETQNAEAREAMDQARKQALEMEQRNAELIRQVETLQQNAQPDASGTRPEDVEALLSFQQESQKIIGQLENENAELRSGKGRAGKQPTDIIQIENEMRDTLKEMARLQNRLAEKDIKISELEKGHAATRSTEQAEVIASISQELRQPMSSIIGYTDLLLGESIGILGALQRKFVERVKASTERLGSLIDDMIQLTIMEAGDADRKAETIDLNLIIDYAMSYTSSQVREKNISIHLDLPKQLDPIHADREALQQILIHLLQNAGAATPVEGTIRLKVEMRSEGAGEYVLLEVTDSGGGIQPEDLPRVFTRLYRADNVLIQGVGDTGVGLSIAKTLAEAQHGRIWVESQSGVGATFSVLLPITGDYARKISKSKGNK